MIETLKKGVYLGLGLASLTKDKVQQLAAEVTREAKLTEEQGRRFQEELEQKAEESKTELRGEIDKRIDQALVQVGLVKAGIKRTADQATEGLQGMVDRRVDEVLSRLKVARQEDIDSLTQRLALLESKMHASPAENPIVIV